MKSKAFTLVELLVVIFILGLLLGILFPVVRKSRQKARSLHCGLNLKKIAAAMSMYEQNNGTFPHGFDFHDRKPPPNGYVGYHSYDMLGWWWFNFLENIFNEQAINSDDVLKCPSRNVQDPGVEEENVLCGNYGVNRYIFKDNSNIPFMVDEEFRGTPLSINQIKQASQALMIIDSGYALVSWKAAVENAGGLYENINRDKYFYIPGLKINEQRDISKECLEDANYGRHQNKSINIAFVDLHIENKKADDLLINQIDGKYTNL
ncbi:MAG: type II secretion system protein, partial [Planctomycetota bacterium]